MTKTYVCVCCRAMRGKGMIDLEDPSGPSYCVKCFTRRRLGDPCFHKGNGDTNREDFAIA
ncbi:MAG: hypothetical protein KGJ86_01210 [Chloroflexota bacterium]|nr:hypothetical protein [Chloroflexota bacterium]